MKVYVASSWRNEYQPAVVRFLRKCGHDVYDFRNPIDEPLSMWLPWLGEPCVLGFGWHQCTEEPRPWSVHTYLGVLESPTAGRGFTLDWNAMVRSEACVLVLPCGRSAHLEAGYFVGAGKKLAILLPMGEKPIHEPELMYKMADLITSEIEEVIEFLR